MAPVGVPYRFGDAGEARRQPTVARHREDPAGRGHRRSDVHGQHVQEHDHQQDLEDQVGTELASGCSEREQRRSGHVGARDHRHVEPGIRRPRRTPR